MDVSGAVEFRPSPEFYVWAEETRACAGGLVGQVQGAHWYWAEQVRSREGRHGGYFSPPNDIYLLATLDGRWDLPRTVRHEFLHYIEYTTYWVLDRDHDGERGRRCEAAGLLNWSE